MARRVLTDLTVSGDLQVDGLITYDDANSELSASVSYGDLKAGPTGYITINLGSDSVTIPYYS